MKLEIAFTLDNVTEQLVSNEEVQQERQGGGQPNLAADPAPIVQARHSRPGRRLRPVADRQYQATTASRWQPLPLRK